MENLLCSFFSIDRKIINEVASRSLGSEDPNKSHESVENPETWNPPSLHVTDVYKLPLSYVFKKSLF